MFYTKKDPSVSPMRLFAVGLHTERRYGMDVMIQDQEAFGRFYEDFTNQVEYLREELKRTLLRPLPESYNCLLSASQDVTLTFNKAGFASLRTLASVSMTLVQEEIESQSSISFEQEERLTTVFNRVASNILLVLKDHSVRVDEWRARRKAVRELRLKRLFPAEGLGSFAHDLPAAAPSHLWLLMELQQLLTICADILEENSSRFLLPWS